MTMFIQIKCKKNQWPLRLVNGFVAAAFLLSLPAPYVHAQTILPLPVPGMIAPLSNAYAPPMIAGIQLDLSNPFNMKFFMDKGQEPLSENIRKQEYTKMVRYFLSSLTIPDENLWVNLSPYEKDRIIPDDLTQTQMGMDLLAQDYLLKMITSSLMYPEDEVGRTFWKKVYDRAFKEFGTTDIPVNTFNKVWIVPDQAIVYEDGDKAWVMYSHLKVMLEEDYFAQQNNLSAQAPQNSRSPENPGAPEHMGTGELSKQIIRDIILPELEKEINEGKNFAVLRQIVSAMVLATWYKRTLKESIIGKVYSNQGKVNGIKTDDLDAKMRIYDQYIQAFKQGAFNYIRKEYDPLSREVIPRKYFSGGFLLNSSAVTATATLSVAPSIAPEVEQRVQKIRDQGLEQLEIGLAGLNAQGEPVDLPGVDASKAKGKSDQAMLTVDRDHVAERKKFYKHAQTQDVVTAYYLSRQNMITALNMDDEQAFWHHYQEMLALVEPLGEKVKDTSDQEIAQFAKTAIDNGVDPRLVSANIDPQGIMIDPQAVREELGGIGVKSFDASTQKKIDKIINEVAEYLARNDDEKKELISLLKKRIQPYHFENLFPERKFQEDMHLWKDDVRDALGTMGDAVSSSAGMFDTFSQNVFVKDVQDEMFLLLVIIHEGGGHFLPFEKFIKIPFNSEIFSFAFQTLVVGQQSKLKGVDEKEFFQQYMDLFGGKKGVLQLFRKGREMGLAGETGFLIDPSQSDSEAGYLVFKPLLLEAHEIYTKLGVDADRMLKDPYDAQRTVGIMLGGILMGMAENDAELKPMLKLRDFLETLYDYYGESSPEMKQWEASLLQEAMEYVEGAIGESVEFIPGADGVWKFSSWRDRQGDSQVHQLIYNSSDAKLRKYDGTAVDDIEGQKIAARERVMGHAFLATAKEQYGFRDLTKKLPEKIRKDKDVLLPLWDRLLLPKITNIRSGISMGSRMTPEHFRPVHQWTARVLKDIYDIENDWFAERKYLSLPVHIQYLDSLIYRWHHFGEVDSKGNVNQSLQDPRIRQPLESLVEKAVTISSGLTPGGSMEYDDLEEGWMRLLFYHNKISEDQIVEIVKNKIWPEYKKLFDIALEEETRKLAYERKIKEQGKEEIAKAFDAFDKQQQEWIDQMLAHEPEEVRNMIKEQARQNLDQMAQQYNDMHEQSLDNLLKPLGSGSSQEGQEGQKAGGQPQASPGASGQQGQGTPKPMPMPSQGGQSEGQGQPDIKDLKDTVKQLENKLNQISSEIDQVSNDLNDIKSKGKEVADTGKAITDQDLKDQQKKGKELGKLSKQIQKEVSDLLNQGRGIAADGQTQKDMTEAIQDGLNTPQEGRESAEISRELRDKIQKLLKQLKDLQSKANDLNKGVGQLNDLLNQPEGGKPQGTQIDQSVRNLEHQAKGLNDQVDQSKQANRKVLEDVHKLQEGAESLEKTIERDKAAKERANQTPQGRAINEQLDAMTKSGQEDDGKPAESKQPQSASGSADAQGEGNAQPQMMPEKIELPDEAQTRDKVLGDSKNRRKIAEKAAARRQHIEVSFDLKKRQEQEDKENYDLTGLHPHELREYNHWKKIKIVHKGRTRSVKQIIADVTERLRILSLPALGRAIKHQLEEGDFVEDFVKKLLDEPAEARWIKKEPLPIKFTFLFDKSGSMDTDSGYTYIDAEGNEQSLSLADWARITIFIMLNAIMDHNEKHRKGKNPIEFEAGVFDETDKILITHQRVREQNFRRERELYNLWKAMEPDGSTQYSKFFHKYVERLIKAEGGKYKGVRIMQVFTDEDVGSDQKDKVIAAMDLAKQHKAYAFVIPMVPADQFQSVLDVHAGHEDFIIKNEPYNLLPYRAFNKIGFAILETAQNLGWLARKTDKSFNIEDNAMLTLPNDAKLERIGKDGNYYNHFFWTEMHGIKYLVFKRDNEEPLMFEMGDGGTEVPGMVSPEKVNTKENEDKIVEILLSMYLANRKPLAAVSKDKKVRVQQIAGKRLQISEKRSDGFWEPLGHTFGRYDTVDQYKEKDQLIYQNGHLIWKYNDANQKLQISQDNGTFLEVDNFADKNFDQGDWVLYEERRDLVLAYHRQANMVLMIKKDGSSWKVEQQVQVPKQKDNNRWVPRVPNLVGEPGTGKDTIGIRAAAHMMNVEVYFVTANPDMTPNRLIQGFRSLRSGTSGYDKTGFARAMNRGAWFVIDEAHKLDQSVVQAFKSLIPDQDHIIPEKTEDGAELLVTMANHPIARMLFTSNIPRASVDGTNPAQNLPMQSRIRNISFNWQRYDKEAAWQIPAALAYARKHREFTEAEYTTFEADFTDFATKLLEITQSLRMRFMGYSSAQEEVFVKDWDLFTNEDYLAMRIKETEADVDDQGNPDKNSIYSLFHEGPVDGFEDKLKRAPTPRVVENILKHYVLFPKDYQYRALSSLQLYYNMLLEFDKKDTYTKVALNRLGEHVKDVENRPLDFSKDSFKPKKTGDDEFELVITPTKDADGNQYWDAVSIPISKDSFFIRTGKLPQEFQAWIDFSQENRLLFYRFMQARQLDRDVIIVGEPGSGKNTFMEALQVLLNAGAYKRKVVADEFTKDQDLTFQSDLVDWETKYLPQSLISGMEAGDLTQMDESNQVRDIENINEISENRQIDDPRNQNKKMIAQRRFQIGHTVNKIEDGFKHAFIDRHMVLGSVPLGAGDVFDMLMNVANTEEEKPISFVTGLEQTEQAPMKVYKINSEILGHEVTDKDTYADGSPMEKEITIPWDARSVTESKYTGILGLFQEINVLQKSAVSEDWVMEEGKIIAPREGKSFVQTLLNEYQHLKDLGHSDERSVIECLFTALSLQALDANDRRKDEWRSQILDLAEKYKLFSRDPKKDAINENFPEGVILETIPLLDTRELPDEEITKSLQFIQTNTRGSGVTHHIQKLSDRLVDNLELMMDAGEELGWENGLVVPLKKYMLNQVKLVYQVVSQVIEKMDPKAEPYNHTRESLQEMNEILIYIRNTYVNARGFNWPIEEIQDEEMFVVDNELVKKILEVVKQRQDLALEDGAMLTKQEKAQQLQQLDSQIIELMRKLKAGDADVLTGDNALDELIFKIRRNVEKNRVQNLANDLETLEKHLQAYQHTYRIPRLREIRDALAATQLDVYKEVIQKLDQSLADLEKSRADYETKLGAVKKHLDEINALLTKLSPSAITPEIPETGGDVESSEIVQQARLIKTFLQALEKGNLAPSIQKEILKGITALAPWGTLKADVTKALKDIQANPADKEIKNLVQTAQDAGKSVEALKTEICEEMGITAKNFESNPEQVLKGLKKIFLKNSIPQGKRRQAAVEIVVEGVIQGYWGDSKKEVVSTLLELLGIGDLKDEAKSALQQGIRQDGDFAAFIIVQSCECLKSDEFGSKVELLDFLGQEVEFWGTEEIVGLISATIDKILTEEKVDEQLLQAAVDVFGKGTSRWWTPAMRKKYFELEKSMAQEVGNVPQRVKSLRRLERLVPHWQEIESDVKEVLIEIMDGNDQDHPKEVKAAAVRVVGAHIYSLRMSRDIEMDMNKFLDALGSEHKEVQIAGAEMLEKNAGSWGSQTAAINAKLVEIMKNEEGKYSGESIEAAVKALGAGLEQQEDTVDETQIIKPLVDALTIQATLIEVLGKAHRHWGSLKKEITQKVFSKVSAPTIRFQAEINQAVILSLAQADLSWSDLNPVNFCAFLIEVMGDSDNYSENVKQTAREIMRKEFRKNKDSASGIDVTLEKIINDTLWGDSHFTDQMKAAAVEVLGEIAAQWKDLAEGEDGIVAFLLEEYGKQTSIPGAIAKALIGIATVRPEDAETVVTKLVEGDYTVSDILGVGIQTEGHLSQVIKSHMIRILEKNLDEIPETLRREWMDKQERAMEILGKGAVTHQDLTDLFENQLKNGNTDDIKTGAAVALTEVARKIASVVNNLGLSLSEVVQNVIAQEIQKLKRKGIDPGSQKEIIGFLTELAPLWGALKEDVTKALKDIQANSDDDEMKALAEAALEAGKSEEDLKTEIYQELGITSQYWGDNPQEVFNKLKNIIVTDQYSLKKRQVAVKILAEGVKQKQIIFNDYLGIANKAIGSVRSQDLKISLVANLVDLAGHWGDFKRPAASTLIDLFADDFLAEKLNSALRQGIRKNGDIAEVIIYELLDRLEKDKPVLADMEFLDLLEQAVASLERHHVGRMFKNLAKNLCQESINKKFIQAAVAIFEKGKEQYADLVQEEIAELKANAGNKNLDPNLRIEKLRALERLASLWGDQEEDIKKILVVDIINGEDADHPPAVKAAAIRALGTWMSHQKNVPGVGLTVLKDALGIVLHKEVQIAGAEMLEKNAGSWGIMTAEINAKLVKIIKNEEGKYSIQAGESAIKALGAGLEQQKSRVDEEKIIKPLIWALTVPGIAKTVVIEALGKVHAHWGGLRKDITQKLISSVEISLDKSQIELNQVVVLALAQADLDWADLAYVDFIKFLKVMGDSNNYPDNVKQAAGEIMRKELQKNKDSATEIKAKFGEIIADTLPGGFHFTDLMKAAAVELLGEIAVQWKDLAGGHDGIVAFLFEKYDEKAEIQEAIAKALIDIANSQSEYAAVIFRGLEEDLTTNERILSMLCERIQEEGEIALFIKTLMMKILEKKLDGLSVSKKLEWRQKQAGAIEVLNKGAAKGGEFASEIMRDLISFGNQQKDSSFFIYSILDGLTVGIENGGEVTQELINLLEDQLQNGKFYEIRKRAAAVLAEVVKNASPVETQPVSPKVAPKSEVNSKYVVNLILQELTHPNLDPGVKKDLLKILSELKPWWGELKEDVTKALKDIQANSDDDEMKALAEAALEADKSMEDLKTEIYQELGITNMDWGSTPNEVFQELRKIFGESQPHLEKRRQALLEILVEGVKLGNLTIKDYLEIFEHYYIGNLKKPLIIYFGEIAKYWGDSRGVVVSLLLGLLITDVKDEVKFALQQGIRQGGDLGVFIIGELSDCLADENFDLKIEVLDLLGQEVESLGDSTNLILDNIFSLLKKENIDESLLRMAIEVFGKCAERADEQELKDFFHSRRNFIAIGGTSADHDQRVLNLRGLERLIPYWGDMENDFRQTLTEIIDGDDNKHPPKVKAAALRVMGAHIHYLYTNFKVRVNMEKFLRALNGPEAVQIAGAEMLEKNAELWDSLTANINEKLVEIIENTEGKYSDKNRAAAIKALGAGLEKQKGAVDATQIIKPLLAVLTILTMSQSHPAVIEALGKAHAHWGSLREEITKELIVAIETIPGNSASQAAVIALAQSDSGLGDLTWKGLLGDDFMFLIIKRLLIGMGHPDSPEDVKQAAFSVMKNEIKRKKWVSDMVEALKAVINDKEHPLVPYVDFMKTAAVKILAEIARQGQDLTPGIVTFLLEQYEKNPSIQESIAKALIDIAAERPEYAETVVAKLEEGLTHEGIVKILGDAIQIAGKLSPRIKARMVNILEKNLEVYLTWDDKKWENAYSEAKKSEWRQKQAGAIEVLNKGVAKGGEFASEIMDDLIKFYNDHKDVGSLVIAILDGLTTGIENGGEVTQELINLLEEQLQNGKSDEIKKRAAAVLAEVVKNASPVETKLVSPKIVPKSEVSSKHPLNSILQELNELMKSGIDSEFQKSFIESLTELAPWWGDLKAEVTKALEDIQAKSIYDDSKELAVAALDADKSMEEIKAEIYQELGITNMDWGSRPNEVFQALKKIFGESQSFVKRQAVLDIIVEGVKLGNLTIKDYQEIFRYYFTGNLKKPLIIYFGEIAKYWGDSREEVVSLLLELLGTDVNDEVKFALQQGIRQGGDLGVFIIGELSDCLADENFDLKIEVLDLLGQEVESWGDSTNLILDNIFSLLKKENIDESLLRMAIEFFGKCAERADEQELKDFFHSRRNFIAIGGTSADHDQRVLNLRGLERLIPYWGDMEDDFRQTLTEIINGEEAAHPPAVKAAALRAFRGEMTDSMMTDLLNLISVSNVPQVLKEAAIMALGEGLSAREDAVDEKKFIEPLLRTSVSPETLIFVIEALGKAHAHWGNLKKEITQILFSKGKVSPQSILDKALNESVILALAQADLNWFDLNRVEFVRFLITVMGASDNYSDNVKQAAREIMRKEFQKNKDSAGGMEDTLEKIIMDEPFIDEAYPENFHFSEAMRVAAVDVLGEIAVQWKDLAAGEDGIVAFLFKIYGGTLPLLQEAIAKVLIDIAKAHPEYAETVIAKLEEGLGLYTSSRTMLGVGIQMEGNLSQMIKTRMINILEKNLEVYLTWDDKKWENAYSESKKSEWRQKQEGAIEVLNKGAAKGGDFTADIMRALIKFYNQKKDDKLFLVATLAGLKTGIEHGGEVTQELINLLEDQLQNGKSDEIKKRALAALTAAVKKMDVVALAGAGAVLQTPGSLKGARFSPMTIDLPEGDEYKSMVAEANELHGGSKINGFFRTVHKGHVVFLSFGKGKVFQYKDGKRFGKNGISGLAWELNRSISPGVGEIYGIKEGLSPNDETGIIAYGYGLREDSFPDNKKAVAISVSDETIGIAKALNTIAGSKSIVDVQEMKAGDKTHYIVTLKADVNSSAIEFVELDEQFNPVNNGTIASRKAFYEQNNYTMTGFILPNGVLLTYGQDSTGNLVTDVEEPEAAVLSKELIKADKESKLNKIFTYTYFGEQRVIAISDENNGKVFEFGANGQRLGSDEEGMAKFLNENNMMIPFLDNVQDFRINGDDWRCILLGRVSAAQVVGQQRLEPLVRKVWGPVAQVTDDAVYNTLMAEIDKVFGNDEIILNERIMLYGKPGFIVGSKNKIINFNGDGKANVLKHTVAGAKSSYNAGSKSFAQNIGILHKLYTVYSVKDHHFQKEIRKISVGKKGIVGEYYPNGEVVADNEISTFARVLRSVHGGNDIWGWKQLPAGGYISWGADNIIRQYNPDGTLIPVGDKKEKMAKNLRELFKDDPMKDFIPYQRGDQWEFFAHGSQEVHQLDAAGDLLKDGDELSRNLNAHIEKNRPPLAVNRFDFKKAFIYSIFDDVRFLLKMVSETAAHSEKWIEIKLNGDFVWAIGEILKQGVYPLGGVDTEFMQKNNIFQHEFDGKKRIVAMDGKKHVILGQELQNVISDAGVPADEDAGKGDESDLGLSDERTKELLDQKNSLENLKLQLELRSGVHAEGSQEYERIVSMAIDKDQVDNDYTEFEKNLGGIDLNPNHMDLRIEKSGAGLRGQGQALDPVFENFDWNAIQGFSPYIINITPASMPMFFSKLEREADIQLSQR